MQYEDVALKKFFQMTHYSDVKTSVMASQIVGVSIVCSTVCSGADQRKYRGSTPLAFVRGIHRSPVDSPHKGPIARKMFPFDDAILKFIFPYMLPKLSSYGCQNAD